MRKIIFVFLIFLSFFSSNSFVFGAEDNFFNEKNEILIEKFVERAKNIIEKKGENYKNLILYSLNEKIENIDKEEKKYKIFTKLIEEIKALGKKEIGEEELKTFNIDIKKIRETWISWINKERISLGKHPYLYEDSLNKTSFEWSEISKKRGYIDHRRNSNDSYYNYNKITSWLKERNILCKKVAGITYSESIGRGTFSCNDDECSDETVEALKGTFDFYMSEKGKSSAPHYNAIINSHFQYIGFGLSIEKTGNKYKYYATTHYCTSLISN